MIKIHATSMSNKKTTISVNEDCTYEDFHNIIRKETESPENSRLKLIFNGKVLKPNTKISDYSITNDSIIVYFVQRRSEKKQSQSRTEEGTTTGSTTVVAESNSTPSVSTIPMTTMTTSTTTTTTATATTTTTTSSSTIPTIPTVTTTSTAQQNQDFTFPPLEDVTDPELLLGLRAEVLKIALESLVNNKQLLMSILNASPKFKTLISTPNGLMYALIIAHPNFINTNVIRGMFGMSSDEPTNTGPMPETTNQPSTTRTEPGVGLESWSEPAPRTDSDVPVVSAVDKEKEDIDDIMEIFPGIGRDYVVRLYNQCGKSKSSTVNFILQSQ